MTDEIGRWKMDYRTTVVGLFIAIAAIAVPIIWDARNRATDRKRDDDQAAQDRYQKALDDWQQQERERMQQVQKAWDEWQLQEQERKRLAALAAAERPILKYLNSRQDNGFTLLTVAHQSKSRHANIQYVFYRITDERELARIRKVVPEQYPGGIGSANPVDDVFFKEGKWVAGQFVFGTRLGINIGPGPANDLKLAILDPRFVGFQFVGELEISYAAGTESTPSLYVEDVPIKGRHSSK